MTLAVEPEREEARAARRDLPGRRGRAVDGRAATLLLAVGHVLYLGGFFLPWITGDFGARGSLTGLDLARVAASVPDGFPFGAAGAAVTVVGCYAVPALAVDALLVTAAGARLRLSPRGTRRLAAGLALPPAVVAVVATALALAGYERADGAGIGLLVLLAGAALCALGARQGRSAA